MLIKTQYRRIDDAPGEKGIREKQSPSPPPRGRWSYWCYSKSNFSKMSELEANCRRLKKQSSGSLCQSNVWRRRNKMLAT